MFEDEGGKIIDLRELTVPVPFEGQEAQSREEGREGKQVVGVLDLPVSPFEAGELERGQTEEPAPSRCEPDSSFTRKSAIFKISKLDVQRTDAFPVPCFNEGFEYEVPFAWIALVGKVARPFVSVTRARWVRWPEITKIHSDLPGRWESLLVNAGERKLRPERAVMR